MREEARDPARINHMIEAANNVKDFLAGKSFQDLKKDKILYFAVVKNIEIIGEAAYKISNEKKQAHPEIPWKDIMGMRHVLVHDYYQVDPETIFKVYSEDIPLLLPLLQKLI